MIDATNNCRIAGELFFSGLDALRLFRESPDFGKTARFGPGPGRVRAVPGVSSGARAGPDRAGPVEKGFSSSGVRLGQDREFTGPGPGQAPKSRRVQCSNLVITRSSHLYTDLSIHLYTD